MVSGPSRERLYDVFSGQSTDVETKVDRALALGSEQLGLPIGFLTRIEGGTQEIVRAVGDHPSIQPGNACPLEEAYCRRTVEIEGLLAVQDATASSAISETAVRSFGLGAYIGASVTVDDETHGTVCFADQDERAEGFTDAETHFVESLASLTGHALERRAYERELDEREAQLDEREEIYRAVVDTSFDLVFRIDTEGRFTFVSEPVEELLGGKPEEYVGRPFVEVLPDEETVELGTRLYSQVLAGHTVENEYFSLESKAGEDPVVDIRATPIYRGDVPPEDRSPADIVGVQGMAREATERLRRERLIRVLNRVLRHNLRNDMTVINGYAEYLEGHVMGEDARAAERIVETSDRLMNLAESARKLEEAVDSPPETESMDVVPVVQRAARQIDQRHPNAAITVETPDAAVIRSAPRLETAVWELLDNAAKHAGDSPDVNVDVRRGDRRTAIAIADDGPGLPDIERAVIATGEETPLVHGKGLGLWLVYWIVESLDGDLRVRDTDRGSCVEMRFLPADAA